MEKKIANEGKLHETPTLFFGTYHFDLFSSGPLPHLAADYS